MPAMQLFGGCGAWITSPSIAAPTPCQGARPSAFAWPPRSALAWSACMYILDEPSIGLHQRDNERLLSTLTHLRDLGNTVLVVEHDEDAIRQADHTSSTSAPVPVCTVGIVVAEGTPAEAICASILNP